LETADLERGLQNLALNYLKKNEPLEAFSKYKKRAIGFYGEIAKPLLETAFAQAQRDWRKGTSRHSS